MPADVSLPEDGILLLRLREADGSEGVVDLRSMAPELLSIGAALAPSDSEAVPAEGEEPGEVFGYLEVSDEAVFTVDGEQVSHAVALEYLTCAVVDALRSAVERPSR